MKYRLCAGLALLAVLLVGLVVQRVLLSDGSQPLANKLGPIPAMPLEQSGLWNEVPGYLAHAEICANANPSSPRLEIVAPKTGVLLLAASWIYDGNQEQEPWSSDCQTIEQVIADGWTPIGKMVSGKDDRHYIFRRSVHAGEKLQVQTRLRAPPIALTVPEADVPAVMAAAPLASGPRKTLMAIDLPAGNVEHTEKTSIRYLALHSPEPELRNEHMGLGVLLRQIVQQGISLAGREELGLSTRDRSLREALNTADGAELAPLEVAAISQPLNEVQAAIFRNNLPAGAAIWDAQLRFPSGHLYERLVTKVEELSRRNFADALKQSGYECAAPPSTRDAAPLPEAVARFGDEFTIPAQFSVIRALHGEVRRQGASPELLSALARSYAMLSVLTDHLWSPASKVFAARALLYAERAVQRWPQAVQVVQSRAYVRALIGLHRSALEDLAAADKVSQTVSNAGGNSTAASAPWVPAIRAYCLFDAGALEAAAEDTAQLRLVRLLQLLAAEVSNSKKQVMAASQALWKADPGCLRALDGGADVRELGVHRQMVAMAVDYAQTELLNQVRDVPELPQPAANLIDDLHTARGAGALARLFRKSPDEMDVRLKVIAALREAGAAESDGAEPSWQVLAQLLEEIDFLHAWWQVDLAANWLAWQTDEVVAATARQIEKHPCADFLASFTTDDRRAHAALDRLSQTLEVGETTISEFAMIQRLQSAFPQWYTKHWPNGLYGYDHVAAEMFQVVRNASEPGRIAAGLRKISPHMPFGVVVGLTFNLDQLGNRKPELEREYAKSPQVLNMLGLCYQVEQRWKDAVRCLRASAALDPAPETYNMLATIYKMQGDEANWVASLDEFLKTEEVGLAHAQIRDQLADHFIQKGDWKRARSYADAAAESWACWALVKAGVCAEAEHDWPAAEKWYMAATLRYADRAAEWYEFCRRTGHGDARGAEPSASTFVLWADRNGSETDRLEAGALLVLMKRPEAAAAMLQKAFQEKGNAGFGVFAAVQFDRIGDAKSRDALLQKLSELDDQGSYNRDPMTAAYLDMAHELRKEFAKENPVQPNIDAIEQIINSVQPMQQTQLLFLMGCYLDQHGKRDEAIQYWRRTMTVPDIRGICRSLAGAALDELGLLGDEHSEASAASAKESNSSNPKGGAGATDSKSSNSL